MCMSEDPSLELGKRPSWKQSESRSKETLNILRVCVLTHVSVYVCVFETLLTKSPYFIWFTWSLSSSSCSILLLTLPSISSSNKNIFHGMKIINDNYIWVSGYGWNIFSFFCVYLLLWIGTLILKQWRTTPKCFRLIKTSIFLTAFF